MTQAGRASILLLLAIAGCTVRDDGGIGSGAGGGPGGGETGGQGGGGAPPDAELVKEWAREITLGTRFGGGVEQVVRWAKAPTLSVMEGDASGRGHLDALLPDLAELMAPHSVQELAAGDQSADIEVYFTALASFDTIAASNGFSVEPGNHGVFFMFWNDSNELTKTFVMIAVDQLLPDELRHFTFEETTQSLGFAVDSAIFTDSIFYANGADGGQASELSELDRRLVRFSYAHLSPGDAAATFDAQFDAHFFE